MTSLLSSRTPRRKGEPDAGREVGADGDMGASGPPLVAVIVEAVVVQQRATTPQVPPGAQRGAQLGRQYRAAGPVEQRVFEKVVAHPLLDRRQAAAVAVRIDETRQQQLATVAENAGAGVFQLPASRTGQSRRPCRRRSRPPPLAPPQRRRAAHRRSDRRHVEEASNLSQIAKFAPLLNAESLDPGPT